MSLLEPMGMLLVDADPQERHRLKGEMERHGWRIWTGVDAASTLRVFSEHRDEISAVIVDLQLPGFEGARVLAELTQLDETLFCCAMSADLREYMAAAFRQLSEIPLFARPIRGSQLDAVLRRWTFV